MWSYLYSDRSVFNQNNFWIYDGDLNSRKKINKNKDFIYEIIQ